jgi:peptidoglycan/xylan/chitin deacetylase (PgdA/CDA1 family)
VHGWDHGYLLGRGRRRVRDELARCRDLAEEVTGIVPAWFRPAYGVLTGPAVLAARELGLRPVLWTDWARDWDPRATPGSIERRLAPGVAGGHVLLLHDADPTGGRPRAATVEALPRVAELARARGLALGPLAEHGLPTRRVAR